MDMGRIIQGISLIISLGLLPIQQSAYANLHANASLGKAKSTSCAACHQPDGNSTNPVWPKLAGQHDSYLYKQLMDFKRGQAPKGRYDPIMTPLMQNMIDQDMRDLALYYSTQKLTPGQAKPQDLKLGEQIYRGGNLSTGVTACIACHGPQGTGNRSARFPLLSGQHPEYTLLQLQHFKNGTRTNGPNGIMRRITARMTDQEMSAVSNYIAGLH